MRPWTVWFWNLKAMYDNGKEAKRVKRLCFGTLLNLIYQARGQNVTYKSICDAVFSVYGCDDTSNRDKSLPSHLKSGHDNVPPDVVDAARNTAYEDSVRGFDENVVGLIADANAKQFIYAIKAVLRDDCISDDTVIGNVSGFEKKNILKSNKFIMASLLACLFRYAIVDVSNTDCAADLKNFEKNYLTFVETSCQIFIDPLPNEDEDDEEENTPLQRTMNDGTFSRTFRKISSVVVEGITHPSTANIYCADLNNGRLRFAKIKEFLADNIGTYVFSRSKVESFKKRPVGAIGTQALIEFSKAYGASAATVLGELILYVFLEQELNAPKIMSKIEFSQHNGLASKSDGIHLLATNEHGRPFNQLVFGASNIEGDLKTAVDRAFERIVSIEQNIDSEFKTVENTAYGLMFDSNTIEYLRDVMIPRKQFHHKPDMAFGMFLGYTLKTDSPVTDSAMYREAAEEQLRKDVVSVKDYIANVIKQKHMEGYTFYCYVLPFNDAPTERTGLIDEILEGR